MSKPRKSIRIVTRLMAVVGISILLGACYPNPAPPNLTPIPTLAPAVTLAPVGEVAVPPTSAPAPTGAAASGDATQGATIFATNCSPCHGQNGQGGGVGPALAKNNYIQTAGDQAIHQTIADGRPGTAMPAWSQAKGGKLTDAQINDVIAYLHTLQ